MSEITTMPSTSFIERILPPSWGQIAIAAAVLAILAAAAITLDDVWSTVWSEGFWSIILIAPTVIIYILIISRVMVPYQTNALNSLHHLSRLDDVDYDQMVQETRAHDRKWAGPALAIGFAFGFIASSPWSNDNGFSWVMWFLALANGLMFGLISLVLQQSLADGRLTTHLQQQPLDFDIFYTSPFLSIGLNSLFVAIAFVGGSTIVVFYSAIGRQSLTIVELILHGFLILCTLLIFFLPMRQTHRVLRQAKLNEQDNLRRHLAAAYRRLEHMSDEDREDILNFATEVNLWKNYEERLKAVPTWPFNAGILRTLFASILIPILVTLGQRLLAYLLVELGIN